MEETNFIKTAAWVRGEILEMIVGAGKGHIGGSLSCVDLLVSLYTGKHLKVDPSHPKDKDRDRLIFSKGHACEALYAILAHTGFFPKEELRKYGKPGHFLGGHIDNRIPGIEVSSGSLGHGLGIGAGLALAARMSQEAFHTFVILGDGECYEGSIWEAAMFAGHHQLSNLTAIVDRNRKITLDFTEDCNRFEPLKDKWESFGWTVIQIDGHSFIEIESALRKARTQPGPVVILAETKKGRGISFMESSIGWHHSVPKGDQLTIARKELGIL